MVDIPGSLQDSSLFDLLEPVPDAILVTAGSGLIEYANRQAELLFGFSRAELIGHPVEMLMPERFRTGHARHHGRGAGLLSRPMGSGLDLVALRKDGVELGVDISLSPFNFNGETKVMAAVRDVSDRRRERDGLEALHEVAVSSSGLLNPTALGQVVVDRARSLLRGDDATLLWYDPQPGALIILADTFVRPFSRPIKPGEGTAGIAFQRGEPVTVEDYPTWEHAVPDAVNRGMKSVVAMPLLVRDTPVGALTVSFTSPRRFVTYDLRILRLLCAQVAPALEAARLHDAMLQMATRVQEASTAKSRFLASMSHELRTPLNAIIGFAELLIDEPAAGYDAARRAMFLEQIHKGGQHLLALINDILDLSKVEAGQMELRRAQFDLRLLAAAAIESVRPLVAQKSQELAFESGEAVHLFADEGKVKQMLLNLLSNAIKFTPEGGRITVSVAQTAGDATVSVTDTGIGIAAADLPRLFTEFEQIDNGLGRHQQGTGLGLALTKRLGELHGGRVGVESEVGRGSRFYFVLPKVTPEPGSTAKPAPSRIASDAPLVLVVEDSEAASTLLQVTLEQAGYRVSIERSGTRVLERAIELRPHAITLDLMLPEPDGWDILRALKETPETRDIPVVVISVLDDNSVGFALGAEDYLVKPVKRETLLKVMSGLGRASKNGARATVLAVDDDAVALHLLKEMLQPQFDVLTAESGAEALDVARTHHPDAMILDLTMPGMSGFEVVAAIKSDPATRGIPIVILTARQLSDLDKSRLNGHVARVMQKGEAGAADLVKWLHSQTAKETATSID